MLTLLGRSVFKQTLLSMGTLPSLLVYTSPGWSFSFDVRCNLLICAALLQSSATGLGSDSVADDDVFSEGLHRSMQVSLYIIGIFWMVFGSSSERFLSLFHNLTSWSNVSGDGRSLL